MTRVQVYLLCHDRVTFLEEVISSILTQTFRNYELVISDNSEGDDVGNFIRSKYPNVRYIRRIPSLPVLEHHRVTLSECTAEYATFFHDDDVMLPEYLLQMVNSLDLYPSISAVACNALIIRNRTLTNKKCMKEFSQPRLLQNLESLLEPYLALTSIGIAPFPGYMYRSSLIQNIYLEASEGGMHSDASFLMKILCRGPILWLPEVLMHYRIHVGVTTGNVLTHPTPFS
jgi:glycosyltransferase involved in cell wall biosynthesis